MNAKKKTTTARRERQKKKPSVKERERNKEAECGFFMDSNNFPVIQNFPDFGWNYSIGL